jgi:multiple antibiotic resistance protein
MAAVASFFKDLGLAFIPLFVAMDAIGSLPFLLALTQEMGPRERTKVVRYAMLTALVLGLGFVAIGKGIFSVLGIEVADFLVAGGLILLILSVKELVAGKMLESQPSLGEEMVGVVPIGMPLVAGPAVLTTLLILADQHSVQVVILAFILNLAVTWLLFAQANRIARLLRPGGLRAASKIAGLLLAAIAVMMIRRGVTAIFGL